MNKSYLNSVIKIISSSKPSTAIRLLLMVLFVCITSIFSFGQSPQTFNASGSFTVPAGVTSITVQAWGAGGAGGGSTNAGSLNGRGGAGGGGGAFASATITVTSGAILPVVVGSGGTGVSGSTGNSGGDSTITGYSSSIYADGGSGGIGNTGGGSPAGGTGGTIALSAGTTKNSGSTGGNGDTGLGINSGVGGAGANSGGAGGNGLGFGTTSNGNGGIQPGGGGGGARTSQDTGNQTGGAGGAGRVIISWTCPADAGTLSGNQYICRYGAMTTTFASTVLGGTWTSSNTGIATVDSSTGVVMAVATGTAIITYTVASSGCTTRTATRTVYVANGPGAGPISISGSTTQCQVTTAIYSIVPDPYSYDYNWNYDGSGVTINIAPDKLSATFTFSASATSGNIIVSSTNACGSGVSSASYKGITVAPSSSGGSIPTSASGCANTYITNLGLTGQTGNPIRWESSTDNFLSAPTIIATTANNINVTGLTQTTYYRAVVQNSPCTNIAYSNVCTVTITPAASIASVTGTSPLCIGGTATYTANTVVLGGGTGAWSSSNTAVATVSTAGLVTGVTAGTADIIYTITGGCGGTSAKKAVTINSNLIASVAIAASPSTSICYGTSVTFTATPTNGGTTPSYQWKLNGANVGTNSATYTNAVLVNGDTVTCIMTSNATPCLTGSPAASNAVTITLLGPPATGVTICKGDTSGATLQSTVSCGAQTVSKKFVGSVAIGTTGSNWSNATVTRLGADDNNYATVTVNNSTSKVINATGFSFSSTNVPSNSIIDNINVEVGKFSSGTNTLDSTVSLIVGGTTLGTNNKNLTAWSTATNSLTNYSFTPTAWGASNLTATQIQNSGFGVAFAVSSTSSRTASVDYISIAITYTPVTVWYTVPSGGTVVQSGNSFNPIGDADVIAQGGVYANLGDTNTLGTYTFYAECSSNPGCRTPVTFVINPVPVAPTVTITPPTCSVNTGTITITAPTAIGMTYSIDGVDYTNTTGVFTLVPIGTYNVTAKLNTGCPSSATSATLALVKKTWGGSSWSPAGNPTADQDIEFTGSYSDPTDITACSCTVTSGIVKIQSGNNLILGGKLTVIAPGTLTFEDTSSLVQTTFTGANTGDITYKRASTTIKELDYTYWSSPVASQNLLAVSPTTKIDKFFTFNPTANDWVQVGNPSTTIMTVGTGYIIRGVPLPATPPPSFPVASFKGVPNNGDITIAVVNGQTSNLIGNPYPSAIYADQFLFDNKLVIDGTIYFWTHNTPIQDRNLIVGTNPDGTPKAGSGALAYTTDDYAVYNLSGGVGTGSGTLAISSGPAIKPTGKIAAGQAFFTTSTAAGGTVKFTNTMRVDGSGNPLNNTNFYKTKNTAKTTNAIEKDRIWLNLTNTEGAFKQALVGYITDATNDYDSRFDGESFDGNEFVDFYSVNNDKNLVIQGRALPFDENDTVPLGFRSAIDGDFTINIDETDGLLANQSVFIEDKLTNTIVDLKTGNYTFNTAAGTFNDRLVLRYSNKTLGTGGFDVANNKVVVSVKNKQIKINSVIEPIDKITIYDLSGKLIYQKKNISANEFLVADFISDHQTFIVKTILQNGTTVSEKVIY